MDRLNTWKDKVEERLRELLRVKEPKKLSEAMSYYLFQPGKRIRPLLTVAIAKALGGSEEDAITVGCAIEMIHNYSLIHDDLPAMDNDDFRRGQPSCHRKFGEAIAILAGDALLTYAFEVLSEPGNYIHVKAEDILSITKVVAVKSGVEGMVGGQALDIGEEKDLEKINLKKTAALFEACFICAGILSQRVELIEKLESTGRKFGLLFQITDDILDRDGYYELSGKGAYEKAKLLYEELKGSIKELFDKKSEEINELVDKVYLRVT